MLIFLRFLFLISFLLSTSGALISQSTLFKNFWEESDTLDKTRLNTLAIASTIGYLGSTLAFNELWYKDYPRVSFHLKDDWILWEHVDKYGHAYAAYQTARTGFSMYKWAGLTNNKSTFIGAGISIAIMNTLEIMDGFSEGWGYSLYDAGFNTFGTALFAAQQLAWKEQRLQLKWSSTRPEYSKDPIATNDPTFFGSQYYAAQGHFGKYFWEYIFKDYNAMTIWTSISPGAFILPGKSKNILRSLCLSVGFGGENIYGAAYNNYYDQNGRITSIGLPRYKQFYLSLDLNTDLIPTNNKLLKTIFKAINIIKFPAPAIEFNTLGEVHFHPFRW
ncbi:MAG: YfiM family protein [Bacteroidetes bacterium]|nr:YfiM family protein [Bacteroidota bacterium]